MRHGDVDNDGSDSFFNLFTFFFGCQGTGLKSVLINYPQVDSYFTRLFEPAVCVHYDYTCARRERNERTFVNYNARII